MATLKYGPTAGFQAGVQNHDRQMERLARMAMSPRQLELNRAWAFYFCEQYSARTTSWDGRPVLSDIERDSIARTQVLPPGFYDPGSKFDDVPLSLRKPTAPYHLVRVVVNRFTGLLFSAGKHPSISVAGNPDLQSWLEGIVKATRMWIRFAYARTFGGAIGSTAVTFKFVNGRPVLEVHDPRWCTPTILDRSTGAMQSLEIRYMYPREEFNAQGIIEQNLYWYRRIINDQTDTVFKPAPVGDGDEPQWEALETVAHGFGECPGVWIRNSQTEELDGEPDCHGEFDTQEAIDRLLAQADQGAVENCDPTLLIESDELKLQELRKGSRNAIKVEKGGGGTYLEMNGAGVEAALKMIEVHRRNFLEVVQCILDSDKADGTQTATEVERRYSSMHNRGDLFREQYGEHGIKPLLAKIVRAAIKMRAPNQPVDPATGMRVVQEIKLPPVHDDNGVPRERSFPLGLVEFSEDMIELTWPEWIERGPSDAQSAAGAVSTARSARALDQESAVQYLAPFFGVDDAAAALSRLQQEGGALDDQTLAALIKADGAASAAGAAAPRVPGAPPSMAELVAHGGPPPTSTAPSSAPGTSPPIGLAAQPAAHPNAAPPGLEHLPPPPGGHDPSSPPLQPHELVAHGAPPIDAGPSSMPPASPPPTKAQDIALNGAQVAAAIDICVRVSAGEVAPDAAIAMLAAFFQLPHEVAKTIVDAQVGLKAIKNTIPVAAPPGPPPSSPPAPPVAG
jgi:hypothetical protein